MNDDELSEQELREEELLRRVHLQIKEQAERDNRESGPEESPPATFLGILGKIILTILAIIVLVPLSLFIACLVGSAFH